MKLFEYQQTGRIQDNEAAEQIHKEIRQLLDDEAYLYDVLDKPDPNKIVSEVMAECLGYI